MIRMLRSKMVLSGIAVAAILSGCSSQAGPTDQVPQAASQQEQKLAPAQPTQAQAPSFAPNAGVRMGPHGGPGFLLRAALKDLDLRADQKTTVEGLLSQLDQAKPWDSPAHRDFQKVLAAGVRAGKLDPSTLDYSAIEQNATAMGQKVDAALNQLHQTLDADQRKQLVAAIEQHKNQGPGKRGMHERGMHGPMAKGPGGPGGPGFGMLSDLNLTDAQKTQLRSLHEANKGDRGTWKQDMKQNMQKLLTAFASDSFDASTLLPPSDMASKARAGAEEQAKRLEGLISVIDASQREKLAARVESGPPARAPSP